MGAEGDIVHMPRATARASTRAKAKTKAKPQAKPVNTLTVALYIFGMTRDEWLVCPLEDLRAKYIELAKKFHPDRNKRVGAEEKFKQVQEAYELLKDKDRAYASEAKPIRPTPSRPIKQRKAKTVKTAIVPSFEEVIEEAVGEFADSVYDAMMQGIGNMFGFGGRQGRR